MRKKLLIVDEKINSSRPVAKELLASRDTGGLIRPDGHRTPSRMESLLPAFFKAFKEGRLGN